MLNQVGDDKLELRDDVTTTAPGPQEVKIKIKACGVCHSDLSAMDGTLPALAPGTYYWRVDETGAAGTQAGEVWRFRVFGPAADALRVGKNATGEPQLTWRGVEAAATHAVLRCDASAAPCVPVVVDAVPAWERAWDDLSATEALVFYRLGAEPCLP